jgi:hypothetical protein
MQQDPAHDGRAAQVLVLHIAADRAIQFGIDEQAETGLFHATSDHGLSLLYTSRNRIASPKMQKKAF